MEKCSFRSIFKHGTEAQQKIVFDNLCEPSCKEICPIRNPGLTRRQENLNIAHGVRVRGTVYFNGKPRIEKPERRNEKN